MGATVESDSAFCDKICTDLCVNQRAGVHIDFNAQAACGAGSVSGG